MTINEPAMGVALWRRVADAIELRIADGIYPAGGRLPPEVEMAQVYGVNRHTVRRALAALAERGLVHAAQGSGTFVETARLAYPLRSRTRFSEIAGAGGREPRGKLIAGGFEEASSYLARVLGVRPGDRLVRIEGLRLAAGVPICVTTTWLDAARFPEAAKVYGRTGSMTKVLAHHGVEDYRRGSTRITSALVEAPDAAVLELGLGRPVLIVDSADHDMKGRAVSVSHARFAAERVEFIVDQP